MAVAEREAGADAEAFGDVGHDEGDDDICPCEPPSVAAKGDNQRNDAGRDALRRCWNGGGEV